MNNNSHNDDDDDDADGGSDSNGNICDDDIHIYFVESIDFHRARTLQQSVCQLSAICGYICGMQ